MSGFWACTAVLVVAAVVAMVALITGPVIDTGGPPVTTTDGHIAPPPGYDRTEP